MPTIEDCSEKYRDNLKVDNGVEILWASEKGKFIPSEAGADEEKAKSLGAAINDPRQGNISVSSSKGVPAAAVIMNRRAGPRRRCFAGTISAPDLIGTWFTTAPEEDGTKAPKDGTEAPEGGAPGSADDPAQDEEGDADPDGTPCMMLELYAEEFYFKPTRFLPKKRSVMEILLSWRGSSIMAPLTKACRPEKPIWVECVFVFGLIMQYMGDKPTLESGMDILKNILGHVVSGDNDFKDEIICQVR